MIGKQMKKVLALLIVIGMIVPLAACGNQQKQSSTEGQETAKEEGKKEPIVIKFPAFQVGVNSGAPVLKKNLELFNEAYGDEIKVEVEEIPGDQAYVDKMKILLSANELPDLVYAGGYNLLDPALQNDAVVDLTPYLEADPEWKASFTEADLEYNSRDGKIYGVPEERQPIGYFYNKELFAKVGIEGPAKTWDEFFEQCEKLKAAGITPLSMDTADSGWLTSLWMASMIGTSGEEGNKFMNTSNIDDFNTPEFIEAAAKIQKMFKEYTTVDAIGGKYENGANNFLSGQTAMIANGPWMIPDFSNPDKAPEGFAEKVGAAIYPDNGMFDAPMCGFFIASKDKEHADAAAKFLKFMTDEKAQLRALEMIGRIPPSPKLEITDEIKQKQPLLAELIELSKEAKYTYGYAQGLWYPNVADKLSTDFPALAVGEITPEEFAQRLTETAQKNK